MSFQGKSPGDEVGKTTALHVHHSFLCRHVKIPNRDLTIEVFRHFPRTAKAKKSRDQGLAIRFAV